MDNTMNKPTTNQTMTIAAPAGAVAASISVAAAPTEAIDDGEMRRLLERIERQDRTNRTLNRMVRKLVGDKAPQPVEVTPQLQIATLVQHPTRHPRPVDDPWWPAGPIAPEAPLAAPAGRDCYSLDGDIEETVGISVIGLTGPDLERVVAEIADEQLQQKAFKPVFLTDQTDFTPFVSRGYAFEYLSGFRNYLEPAADDERADRMAMLVRKWGLREVISRDRVGGPGNQHLPLAALSRHNAGMSQGCHRDRFKWIIETLRIALATERYDVAEGLANYVHTFFDDLAPANQAAAARVLCRKFIAFGEQERLRRFLFKNIAQVKKDDNMFTWFSVHCTDASHFAPELATLPSGKPNSYYISKRLAAAAEQAVPNLLAATDGATISGNLLLANHFAQRRDAALYRMFVNRVIAKDGGAVLSRVDFGRGNLLAHLAFEKRRPPGEQQELVSVIMSAYNAADTIEYAARSILGQSHGNLELLICDDCSTDETSRVLGELSRDPRVRLFRSVSQQGTYNIRNSLIREARGSYLTFQDSDDFAFPDRLERQLAFLKQEGAAAVVAQWFRVTAGGEFVFSSEHAVARLAVVSLFAPRRVFERFGPYRAARFGADTEFYEGLRMRLGTEAVRLMPSPVIFGLSAATSLTRSAGIEATEDGFRAPARRAYAAAAARQRQVGGAHAGLISPDEVLDAHGILMADAGVRQMEPEAC